MPAFDVFVNKHTHEVAIFPNFGELVIENDTNIHCENIDDLNLRLIQTILSYGVTCVSIINMEERPEGISTQDAASMIQFLLKKPVSLGTINLYGLEGVRSEGVCKLAKERAILVLYADYLNAHSKAKILETTERANATYDEAARAQVLSEAIRGSVNRPNGWGRGVVDKMHLTGRFKEVTDFLSEKGVDTNSEAFNKALYYAKDGTLEEEYFATRKVPSELHKKITALRDLAGMVFDKGKPSFVGRVKLVHSLIEVFRGGPDHIPPSTPADSSSGDNSPPLVSSPTDALPPSLAKTSWTERVKIPEPSEMGVS